MADDEEYVEHEAVVRMRKGERLADSKKTEGWSRGFTPKSSEKGPEHVEIRLKDGDENLQPDPEPHFNNVYTEAGAPRAKTREREELEQLLQALVLVAIIKAAEVSVPRIKEWWLGQALPFFKEKREEMRRQWARRKALREAIRAEARTVSEAIPRVGMNQASDALEIYEANMSSVEARQHLAELLIAQHFVQQKKRLLAHARIEDAAIPPELAGSVRSLTSEQVANALDSLLASRPEFLNDLANLLDAGCRASPLQLGSETMKVALRLTDEPG